MGDYLIKYERKTNSNNKYPILTSSRRGIFFQSDYYNKQIASKNNTGYNIVPRNYFTYRHMSDDGKFTFNINDICDFGIVSTLYPVFKTNVSELNPRFLKTILNNGNEFKRYSLLQKQGGSRTYMYYNKLSRFKLTFPEIQEQEKIDNLFSKLDELITFNEHQQISKQIKQNQNTIAHIKIFRFEANYEVKKI